MSAEVIKEFLISLSFAKDETGFHRTMEAVEGLTKKMVVLGGAIEAAAIASVAAMHRIAMGMESVGYASSRIGASVSGIKEFQFAISQLGGTAAGAMSSLENFSRFMRESPGGEAWLRGFGIATRDAKGQLRDRKELMDEFFASKRFTTEPYWAKLRDSRFIGIDEDTMRGAMNPDRAATEAEARAKYRNAGSDPEKMAEAGRKFEQVWRSLGLSIDIIADKVAMAMAGPAGDKFRQLIDYLDRNSGKIADGLIMIGNAIVDCAGQLISWVAHVAEWEEMAEKWIAANPKIADGLKAITDALGPLGTALAALATGGVALRGLIGLLGLAGLGGIASFVAGGAIIGGAIGAYNATPGADEKPPEGAIEEGAHSFDKWAARKWRQRPKWLGGTGGESIRKGSRSGAKLTDEQRAELAAGIRKTAGELGVDPKDLAGLISFETGGTMDPWKKGPTTKWGQHRGLIQWGEPQRKQYGIDENSTITEQMAAVSKYLRDHGVKPGMDLPHLYSAVLHGNAASGLDVTDANGTSANGGARSIMGSAHYGALAALERRRANAIANATNGSGLNGWLAAGGGYANAAPLSAAPIGHSSVNSYDFGNNIMNNHAKTTIVINGAGDPGATADAVAKKQGSLYSDALRNLQGAAR